jgi:fibronectin-binding autotransporter adhesin
MESVIFFKRFLASALAFFAITSHAQNIGFESGNLTGWTAGGGDVGVSTGLNNVSYGGGLTWTITPYGTYMAQLYPSGSITFDGAVSNLGLNSTENTAIRSFMQVNAGGGNPTPTNATWIKRSVALQAGVTYSFAWNYLSTDYTPFNDGSMMSLVHATKSGVVPTLNNNQQRYALLGFTNPGTGNYSTDSYGSTGWQLATFTVPEDGDYVLGFATFNLGDTILSPMLFIDEIQGATLKNGQSFEPVPPNPGSNAPVTGGNTSPTLCCGGSAEPFNANAGFNSRVTTFINTNVDNRVQIEQVGNNSTISVQQTGKRNYTEIESNGSNNNITISQTTNGIGQVNYTEVFVSGSSNSIGLTQNNTGGNKGIYAIVGGAANGLTINQSGTGNHYAEINLAGGSKTVDLTQSGSAGHMSRIELTGSATSLTATQTGSTQQFYSITHNCAQTSCAAITVTQGQ